MIARRRDLAEADNFRVREAACDWLRRHPQIAAIWASLCRWLAKHCSERAWRDCSMPLTRGRIVGYDSERLAFGFTMHNDGETVQCQISDAAMDQLAGVKGTLRTARQAQFLEHRDAVEKIASDLFDEAPIVPGSVVRIFTKHIRGQSTAPPE